MAIKKVTYYETTNGLTFQDESKAIEAEKTYQIKQSLFNMFDAGDFSERECSNICTYIAENLERFKEIVNES